MEQFTFGPIYQNVLIWFPFLIYWFQYLTNPIYIMTGYINWLMFEYITHRWIYHSQWLPREIPFLFHLVHHKQPNDWKRLSTPLSISVPILLGIYFFLGSSSFWQNAHVFGFLMGFLIYDITHLLSHVYKHAPFRTFHMIHHLRPTIHFGFTSSIGDYLCGTL